tara:strand:- start:340 stop:570 length:231 start_codon:yes stop_codon:yes gene_type:complete
MKRYFQSRNGINRGERNHIGRIESPTPFIKGQLADSGGDLPQVAAEKRVRPAGLEPATYGSANRRSIQLSHGRIIG